MQPSIIISKDMVENADQIFLQKIKNVKKHSFCVEITKNDGKNICTNFIDSHQYQECLDYFLEVLPRHSYNHKKNNKNHYKIILEKHSYLMSISSKMRPFKDIIKSSRDYITQYFCHFKEKYFNMEKKVYDLENCIKKESASYRKDSLKNIKNLSEDLYSSFFGIFRKFNKLKLINQNNFKDITATDQENISYKEWCFFSSKYLKIINTVLYFIYEMKLCRSKMRSLHKIRSAMIENTADLQNTLSPIYVEEKKM